MPWGSDPTADQAAPAPGITATIVSQQPQRYTAQQLIDMGLNPALAPYFMRESGGRPNVGYTSPETFRQTGQFTDLSNAPLDATGHPAWAGDMGPQGRSTAAGLGGITETTWGPIAEKLGITDFSVPSQIKVANELYKERGLQPWQVGEGGWGKDSVVSSGNWNPSPKGLLEEAARPNTTLYGGTFDDYKSLTDLTDADTNTKKQTALADSLGKGEDVHEPPVVDVKVKDGKAYVIDQDGFHRAQAAEQAGVNFIPISFRGLKPSDKVTELVTPSSKTIPFNFKPYPLPPEKATWLKEIGHGLADPFYGAAQIGARMPLEGEGTPAIAFTDQPQDQNLPQRVDAAVQQREQQIEQERAAAGQTGTDWWRLAGNVASTIPLAWLGPGGDTGALANFGRAAMQGAVGGMFAPVTQPGNFGEQKAEQMGLGAAAGGGLSVAGNAIGRIAQPYIAPAAQRLMDAGVRLTPGMMRGGALKGAENRLSSIVPTIGGAIKRAIEDFNKVAYNRVLSRIGEKYEGSEVGYEGIANVEKRLNAEYNKVLKDVEFRRTPKFDADLANLRELASEMPRDEASQFEAIVNNRVLKRMGPEGAMDGQTFKQVESELSQKSRELHRSDIMGQRQLGDAVDTVNGMLRENVEDQNPGAAAALRKANAAWAAFVRIRGAAANRSRSDGTFSPGDLLTASKRAAGVRVFARGDALMQDLARDAQQVIPNTYPESGTAGRILAGELMGGGAMALLSHPGVLATVLGTNAAYTRPGVVGLRFLAGAGGPATRNMLARAARQTTNALAPAAGMTASPAMQYTITGP